MDGIGWSESAMAAAQMRLDTATENLANASTTGFQKAVVRGSFDASGVHVRRVLRRAQAPLRPTGRALDFAIAGPGAFRMREADGTIVTTRSGAFRRDRFGRIEDDEGRVLLGRQGALRLPQGASLEPDGRVLRGGIELDRLPLPAGSTVRSGFLEASNVDAIGEMIDVLTAQRSYETAQKVLTAIDQTRERSATQVGEVKA